MIAVDTSVVVAGFATWHDHHLVAMKALQRQPRLVGHAAVETYSVLTRFPPPYRAQPGIVHEFLASYFEEPYLTLSETGYRELLATAATGHLLGGQIYDAMIAFTAAEHEAILLSLDRRATVTYESIGATVDQLVP